MKSQITCDNTASINNVGKRRMQQVKSKTHRAMLSDDGVVNVYQIAKHCVEETTFDSGKPTIVQFTVDNAPDSLRKLLEWYDKTPVLRFAADTVEWMFHVDVEAGPSRWQGTKPEKAMKKLLKSYGFDKQTAREILEFCKDRPNLYVEKV